MKRPIMLIAFLCLALAAMAQQPGEIRGTVLDAAGNGIAGAHIDIVSASGAKNGRSTVTDADGRYAMIDLRAGKYAVQYSTHGCGIRLVNHVIVNSDQSTVIHIVLRPAAGKQIEVIEYVKPFLSFQDTRIE